MSWSNYRYKLRKNKKCKGRAPQKKRGSGTSLSKVEGSRAEVSLLSANPAPLRASDNQTGQGSGEEVPLYRHKLLVYIGKQGVFSKGWTNHVKGQIVICHSCTNHVKGQILIYHSCTNHIKSQVVMLHCNRSLWWSRTVHVHRNQESQSKVLTNKLRPRPRLVSQAPS